MTTPDPNQPHLPNPSFDLPPIEATPLEVVSSLPPKPNLPGSVILRATVEDLIDSLAADLLFHAKNCVRAFGDFHLALSGGSTPEPFYRRLMYDPNYRDFPWKRTHLWVVDERRVEPDDDRCNFKMIRETIVAHSDIPAEQVHPMDALAPDADLRYETELRDTLAWREKGHDRLDYTLLGMGADAHTASLFPHSPALDSRNRLILINEGPNVTPPDRVTMTFDLINASRFIAIMVTGEKKRGTIAKIAAVKKANPAELPITGIQPLGGELRWYLDAAAVPG